MAKLCDHETSNNLQVRLYIQLERTTVTELKDAHHTALNLCCDSTTVEQKTKTKTKNYFKKGKRNGFTLSLINNGLMLSCNGL